jgi:hypothetical protein
MHVYYMLNTTNVAMFLKICADIFKYVDIGL